MNMQAIMQQAQKMQKKIMQEQEEIQKMEFVEENSQITVKANGKKEIIEIKFEAAPFVFQRRADRPVKIHGNQNPKRAAVHRLEQEGHDPPNLSLENHIPVQ